MPCDEPTFGYVGTTDVALPTTGMACRTVDFVHRGEFLLHDSHVRAGLQGGGLSQESVVQSSGIPIHNVSMAAPTCFSIQRRIPDHSFVSRYDVSLLPTVTFDATKTSMNVLFDEFHGDQELLCFWYVWRWGATGTHRFDNGFLNGQTGQQRQ